MDHCNRGLSETFGILLLLFITTASVLVIGTFVLISP
jgi:hypothetical protein